MKLQDYRKLRKLTRAAFGKMVGVSGIQVWRYEVGISMPKPDTVEAIRVSTDNAVTADDHHRAIAERKAADAAKVAA